MGKRIFKIFLRFVALMAIIFLALSIGFVSAALTYLYALGINPTEISQIAINCPNLALTSEIYDRNGNLLAQAWGDEFRYPVSLSQVPQALIDAIVATEDKNFWRHNGIDLPSILRAISANIQIGMLVEGASTITQQLVRQFFLSYESTLKRKITEALLALRMETQYSKEEILQIYLNSIYFGEGAYGAEAAARTYFGKHVQDLNLPESAFLAGLITAPSVLSPYTNFQVSKNRQLEVLKRMQKNGMISEAEAAQAAAYSLTFRDTSVTSWQAPYFVDWIKQLLIDKYGEEELFQGGLRVYTSLDLRLQKMAEEGVREAIGYWQGEKVWPVELVDGRGVPQPQLALVAIDPQNGDVLAMIGGTSYKDSEFNRALALRQPGSAFKIFVYAAALEEGTLHPTDILVSEPIQIEGWSPSEYRENPFAGKRYYGPLSVREALVHSSNIAALKVAMKVGLDKVIQYAQKMGITTPLLPYPSLAIGSNEVKPIEMAQAYAILATNGIRYNIRPLLRVEKWDGTLLDEFSPEAKQIISAKTACQMTDYFTSVIKATSAYIPELPSAGKTGTTDLFKDAWFCGYTPHISCVVFTGNDSASVPFSTRYNIGMYLPASIWRSFISRAKELIRIDEFEIPPGEEKVTVYICEDSGLLATDFCPEDRIKREVFLEGTSPTRWCPLHREQLSP